MPIQNPPLLLFLPLLHTKQACSHVRRNCGALSVPIFGGLRARDTVANNTAVFFSYEIAIATLLYKHAVAALGCSCGDRLRSFTVPDTFQSRRAAADRATRESVVV